MATLFSLISCMDYLERAYVRGAITEEAYTPTCLRLLAQYKTAIKLVADPTKPHPFRFVDVDAFMAQFNMDCSAAAHRLALGIPATVEHAGADTTNAAFSTHAQRVAETTQNFITLMDALKLRMRAKDQLHPLFSDLLSVYTKVGAEEEGRAKLLQWLISLNKLSASAEVDEEQAREVR
ncbi:Vps28p [Malassezia vespertilionis]|uniref:Vps28p n=1 Tax=Malassezia vespertilionis TaxID=2020962 RepID=A0A2N1JGI9_9BASI|nr:Vps28p [Malassezia vespertilionis]